MAKVIESFSASGELANRLEQEIYRRGLRRGDRYLTDKEAAQMFQVSAVTVNRAMRELGKRKVIVRRQRAGTFVGPSVRRSHLQALRCVHFLMLSHFRRDYPIGSVLDGLRQEMPETQIQLNFLPGADPLPFVQQLIDHSTQTGTLAGLVVDSVTREIRQFLYGRNLPVVVAGHCETDVDLPWVDRDQRQIGQLLARHMIEQGHQRIGLLMREHWAVGDNLLAGGVSDELHDANATLTVASAPVEEDLITTVVKDMLSGSNRPTAMICRSESLAIGAAHTVEAMGLSVPQDVMIGAAIDLSESAKARYRFPHASFDPIAFGASVGRLLKQRDHGQRPDPDHYEIPVKLIVPAPKHRWRTNMRNAKMCQTNQWMPKCG